MPRILFSQSGFHFLLCESQEKHYSRHQSLLVVFFNESILIKLPGMILNGVLSRCSHLRWLSKDHHSGDLVAADEIQPARCSALPQRLCRCVHTHTHSHEYIHTNTHGYIHVWPYVSFDLQFELYMYHVSSPPYRCSHQTLWCGERMAGAGPVQLHLTSVCGAQFCCM